MKFVISVGSYERILYGIDVELSRDAELKRIQLTSVKESFAVPAHTGYVKCVASCPRYLVSGATDETIRLFDLRTRKDIGALNQHQGSVTCLAFAGNSHLLSGGEDGRIGLFRCKDWECLHVLRHKKPLQALAVHPTNKLALSVGKERSLRLWNLMTGKQAHSSVLPYEPLRILFSASGKYYVVMGEYTCSCYEAQGAKSLFEFKSKSRLASMAILRDERIFLAGEGSLIQIIDIDASVSDKDVKVSPLETGLQPRIKDLATVAYSRDDILVAGCSSGTIKGFTLPDLKELFSHESKIRITCLTVTSQ